MLVQPQPAATVCEFDLVPHTIGSLERAQTLDPNPRPESSHEPLNLTLDLEHAHVNDRSRCPAAGAWWRNAADLAAEAPLSWMLQWPVDRKQPHPCRSGRAQAG